MAARNGSGFWKKVKWCFLRAVLVVVLVLFGLEFVNLQHQEAKPVEGGGRAAQRAPFVTLENLPEYTGRSFVVLYGNKPQFSEEFKAKENPYYSFTPLDALGRCGPAMACIGQDLMPTEPRGSISGVKPSGWNQAKYPGIIEEDPPYLYNRCHLIAYQLSGENANERNLITGTRYFNVTGMQPWEDQVASYVRRTGNHVMYRVTPVFEGREKVARGVRMEAFSVEDRGQGICFDIFVYNVQPGVRIEYSTGNSTLE
jgi:DNA-entry nuclease